MIEERLTPQDRAIRQAFMQEFPELYCLLVEAIPALSQAFGSTWYYKLDYIPNGPGILLRAQVQLPRTFEGDAEAALAFFDKAWWLSQRYRSGGSLIFDCEVEGP